MSRSQKQLGFPQFPLANLVQGTGIYPVPSYSAIQGGTYVCLEPGAHNVRRTENGNVIAHDSRDDQEFILQNAVPMKSQTSFWKP